MNLLTTAFLDLCRASAFDPFNERRCSDSTLSQRGRVCEECCLGRIVAPVGDTMGRFAPEVNVHMDFSDDVKALQPQHVVGLSRTARPFDWLGWMRQLVLPHPTAPSTIQLLLTQPPFDANHATAFYLAFMSLMDAVAASAGSYDPIARVI